MFLSQSYRPQHGENRMRSEGDVVTAREHFFEDRSANLRFLLSKRYAWMNEFIRETDRGIEVGAGAGTSKEFIRCREFLLTDYAQHPWLDVANVDALATPFEAGAFDFVVSSNMIHHVPYPKKFFREMHRVLKPGGYLLIQEINASLTMQAVLRMMRHEGYSFDAHVFDESAVCTDENDLWSANCAIPNLLFDDLARFQREIGGFAVERTGFSEFLVFLNSGGVIAKTFSIPLPGRALKLLDRVDAVLTRALPQVFALQRHVVLRKLER